jgi:hypothetical protein
VVHPSPNGRYCCTRIIRGKKNSIGLLKGIVKQSYFQK